MSQVYGFARDARQGTIANLAADQRDVIRTVLIGLGGTGVQVLLRLRRKLYETEGTPTRAGLSFVCIDTMPEPELLKEAPEDIARRIAFSTDPQNPEYVAATVDAQSLADYINMPLAQPWGRWIPPAPWNFTKIDRGANAFRPAGRLAFYHNYDRIKTAIERAEQRVSIGGPIQCIVVCSLAGGTGTGMFLDIGLLLQKRWIDHDRLGFFVMPEIFPDDKDQAIRRINTYAALKELELFQASTTLDSERDLLSYRFPNEEKAISRGALYAFAYILGGKNEAGIALGSHKSPRGSHTDANNHDPDADRAAFFEMIAENIWWDLAPSAFSNFKRGIRSNLNGIHLPNDYQHAYMNPDGSTRYLETFSTRYMSMACTKLERPIERLLDRCKYLRALDIINHRLAPKVRLQNLSEADVRDAVMAPCKIGVDDIRGVLQKAVFDDTKKVVHAELRVWGKLVEGEALRRAGGAGGGSVKYIQDEETKAEVRFFDGNQMVKTALARQRTRFCEDLEDSQGAKTTVRRALQDRLDDSDRGLGGMKQLLDHLTHLMQQDRDRISGQIADQEKRLETSRRRLARALEDLSHVETEWGTYHPLRKGSLPILINRAASAAQAVLQCRYEGEVNEAIARVNSDLKAVVKNTSEEVRTLSGLLEKMRQRVQDLLETHKTNQQGRRVPGETPFDDIEVQQFYVDVRLALCGDARPVGSPPLAGLPREDIVKERDALSKQGKSFLPAASQGRPGTDQKFEELVFELLKHCHDVVKQTKPQLVTHILDYTRDGQMWWTQQIDRMVDDATPWWYKDAASPMRASDKVAGYACLGIEPHGEADSLKTSLTIGMGPHLKCPSLAIDSNGTAHAAVLIYETGGFPLLTVNGISQWYNDYLNPPNQWQVHLDPRFYDIRDLVLMSPDRLKELDEIYECLVYGVIVGEITRTRADDGVPHFWTRRRIGGELVDLGPEIQAVKRLRTTNDAQGLRGLLLDTRIRPKIQGAEILRDRQIQLLKIARYYEDHVYNGIPATQRGRELGAMRIHELLEHLRERLSSDGKSISDQEEYDLICQPPGVGEFTVDPCQDGWLSLNANGQ